MVTTKNHANMTRTIKIFLPIIILVVSASVAWQIFANGPKVKRLAIEVKPPLVEVLTALEQDVKIPVFTQGTVTPRTSIQLAAQVSGNITKVSSKFANGGFFKKNETLLSVDKSEYRLEITKAKAVVARAKQQLARAEVDFNQAKQEIESMGKKGSSVTAYALKRPQLEEAKANLKAAQADLEIAELQLDRCDIRAPFDGRVLEKIVGVGQYIVPGQNLAHLYAVDIAEVRLPISETQAGLLDIPYSYQGIKQKKSGPSVTLQGKFAGRNHSWQGDIVRTEGGIDEKNRLLYVVAQVLNPYKQDLTQPDRPPLSMGMFVQAEIDGRQFNGTYVLPRSALHGNDVVWLLNKESRLELLKVTVLFRGPNHVYINGGIENGDSVIISPLDAIVNGMLLRVADMTLNLE